jgi:hypothetical protein
VKKAVLLILCRQAKPWKRGSAALSMSVVTLHRNPVGNHSHLVKKKEKGDRRKDPFTFTDSRNFHAKLLGGGKD